MKFELKLAEKNWEVDIPLEDVRQRYIPLVSDLFTRWNGSDRLLVYLAGAPGSGKSTFAALFEQLAGQLGLKLQALPMDGFHFPNSILARRRVRVNGRSLPLRSLKGCPESYDFASLLSKLRYVAAGGTVKWPIYDRNLHEPVPDVIEVEAEAVIVVEGNYLLLEERRWRDLRRFADLAIFVDCPEATARDDLVARHISGGRLPVEAAAHYELNDLKNRNRVYSHRQKEDILIRLNERRRII